MVSGSTHGTVAATPLSSPGTKRFARDRAADLGLVLLAVCIGLAGFIRESQRPGGLGEGPLVVDIAVGSAACLALLLRRRWPVELTAILSVVGAFSVVAGGAAIAGGETLGGLWMLLVGWTALRGRALPTTLAWFGAATGLIGLASTVPALAEASYAFGLLQIAWFAWLGTVLIARRTNTPRPVDLQPALGTA